MDTTASTQWLTAREASAHAQVSLPTIRRAIKSGMLPAYVVNTGVGRKRVRLRLADIDAWLTGTPAARGK